MQLVKFALTHSVCPFFVQYFALLAARFGPGFDTDQSNLPWFPASNGDMLLKHQIITANRSVIAMSGTAPTMIDGIGNTRQRVGGHVCRVVGVVWLHQNLTDLHFVQLFTLWGRRLSRGTSQTLRCTNKHILQLVHHQRSQPTKSVNVLSNSPEVLPMSHQARVLRAAVAQNITSTHP